MDVRLTKIWRDLTERKGRTVLTIIGLAVGFWGLASIAIAWFVLRNDLAENFQSTNPPAIAITLASAGPVDLAELDAIEGVANIENRPRFSGRMEINPDQWMPAVFWIVEDFSDMKVAKVFAADESLPPPEGSLVLERSSRSMARFMRVRRAVGSVGHRVVADKAAAENAQVIGSEMRVKLGDGQMVAARISGIVFDPAQAPSNMEQVMYGYMTRATAKLWLGKDPLDRLLVDMADSQLNDGAIRRAAALIESKLRAQGHDVIDIRFPSATEHVHQFQMNSILFLLGALGVLAMMMSSVLAINLINSILTSQIRQIGVLKAIGASVGGVVLMYLCAMLTLGLLASLVAWPLAVKTAYKMSAVISAFLNFDVLTTSLPLPFIGGLLLLGIMFPVLASIMPVRRWARVPVTDAFQYFGANPNDESGKFINWIPLPLSINVRMGIRNAFRKPRRLALTVATVAAGLLVFMVTMNMRSSLIHTAESEEAQKRFDVMVNFEPTDARNVRWMGLWKIVERAETWKMAGVTIAMASGEQSGVLPLKVVPAGSQVMRPYMLDGRWLDDEGEPGVVINQRLQYAHPELVVGGQIEMTLDSTQVRLPVIGIMKEFGGSSIYIRDADYRSVAPNPDNLVNAGYITLKEPSEENLARLQMLLEQHFDIMKLDVYRILSAKIASRIIRNHLDVIVAALLVLAVLMVFVSSLGKASAISTSVVERTREIGILRAIGGRPRAISLILLSEALFISLLGWGLALVLSQPISRFAADYFGTALVEYPFDYLGSVEGFWWSLFAAAMVAIVATAVPVRVALRQSIRSAIAYE